MKSTKSTDLYRTIMLFIPGIFISNAPTIPPIHANSAISFSVIKHARSSNPLF